MRAIPFVLTAAILIFISFVGGHPSYLPFTTIVLLVLASLVLLTSYVERPSSWGVAPARVVRRTWSAICVSTLLALSVPATQWPLHLAFGLSRSSINALVSRVKTSLYLSFPCSMGVFSIYGAERRGGLLCLLLDEDQSEPLLLVRGQQGQVKKQFANYDIVVLDHEWCLASSM